MEQAKLILKITAATWITTLFSTISFGRLTPNAPRSCMEVYRYIYHYGFYIFFVQKVTDYGWMDGCTLWVMDGFRRAVKVLMVGTSGMGSQLQQG